MQEPAAQSPESSAGPVAVAPDQYVRAAGRSGTGAAGQIQVQPGFSCRVPVFFDDLDAMGMLHNARYLVLLERASSAFFEASGWRWERDPALNPDQHFVVREQTIRYLEPIRGPGDLTVVMWVARLGETSVTFGFEIRSPDGSGMHASAERVHVKLDLATFRPVPWTPRLRGQLMALARPAGPVGPAEPVRGAARPGSAAGWPA